MTTFLIFLSIFLNILTMFAVIILFLRQNRLLQIEKKQEKMFTEMEEVISSYIVQMKEDNEDFIKRLNELDLQSTHSDKSEQKNRHENIDNNVDHNRFQNRIGKASVYNAAIAYKQNSKTPNIINSEHDNPPSLEQSEIQPSDEMNISKKEEIVNTTNNENEFQEQSLLSRVYQLKEQGHTEESIAKKLNKGKTEIELLLKFNQKN